MSPPTLLRLSRARREALVAAVRRAIPSLSGLWIFGSRSRGEEGSDSDLDVALLADTPAEAMDLWTLAGALEDHVGVPVDLLDLRAVSTVMQYQVVTRGERLWARDVGAPLYETFILSEKTKLDEARAGLLEAIGRSGRVHGG